MGKKKHKDSYVLSVHLTRVLRERIHELEAELWRDDDAHVTASEIVRVALDLTLGSDKLKREILKRRSDSPK